MNIDISKEEVELIVNMLRFVDVKGFWTKKLQDKIISQAEAELKKRNDNTPPEELVMIKKLEQEIKKESNQPSGFMGV